MFSKKTTLSNEQTTHPVRNNSERKNFVLAAYNAGEGRIAAAQQLADRAGKNPEVWANVASFLELAGASSSKAKEIREYVELVPVYETEFAEKSQANKKFKQKKASKGRYRCTEGHWRTIDDRPVFICD